MSKKQDLDGIAANVEFGPGGARMKDIGGVMQVRNAADAAFARLQADDGTADDDVVTKRQLDASGGASFSLHDTTHSPVGLWQFDGDATDSSGNGYDLVGGGGLTVYTAIRGRRFRYFDGTSWLTRAATPALTIHGALTVEMIIACHKRSESAAQEFIAGVGGPTNAAADNAAWTFRNGGVALPETAYFAEFGSGTNISLSLGGGTHPVGSIAHIAWTRAANGLDFSFYCDGIELSSASATNASDGGSSAVMTVGANVSGGEGFQGAICSLKVIAQELTPAEVLAEYDRTLG